MNAQQFVAYFNANGISYDKDFVHAHNESCIAEYLEVQQDAYTQLEKYVVYGLNNGFEDDLKESITKLTKIIVNIGNEKTAKNRGKFLDKLTEMEKALAKLLSHDNSQSNSNVVVHVLEYVSRYRSSVDAKLNSDSVVRAEVLQISLEKLTELGQVVEQVAVTCTNDALDYAQKIIACLKAWASDVVVDMHTDESNKHLNKAIQLALDWGKMTVGYTCKKTLFGKKKDNLVTDVSSIIFKEDPLTQLGASVENIRRMQIFCDNLERYKKQLEQKYNTDVEYEKLKALKQQEKDLVEGQKNLAKANVNGEIDDLEFVREAKRLAEKLEFCREDIAQITKTIDRIEGGARGAKKVLRRLEMLSDIIMGFKYDPEILNYIVEKINFNSIMNVINGRGSDEDVKHIMSFVIITNGLDKQAQEKMSNILQQFADLDQNPNLTPVRAEVPQLDHDAQVAEEERIKKEAEALRKKLLGLDTPTETPVETPVEKPVQVSNNITDIIDDN